MTLDTLQHIEEQDTDQREAEERCGVADPGLLPTRVHPHHAVEDALDGKVAGTGEDAGHVVAEGDVHEGEDDDDDADLQGGGECGVHVCQNLSGKTSATSR